MKVNMPVTDNEVHFSENETLVSKTDLKGAITYVNKEFIHISGFTEDELIGKNHNIVRHPDMPPEAFKDLWDTLKAGKPWIQMVKNRCKNGDFYWVKANVTPVLQNGQVVEYMSVRAKPSREEVAAAEVAFKQLKDGKISLLNGNPITSKLDLLASKLGNITLTQQFSFLAVILALFLALISWELSVQKQTVDFAAKETLGLNYVLPVRQLIEHIPQHRGMTNAYLNGAKDFEAKIYEVRSKVDGLFADAFEEDKRTGAELGLSADLKAVHNEWETLKSRAMTLSPVDSFEQHTTLIKHLQHLMIKAGEHSNLILDTDLGSAYATDLIIYRLPALTDYMGQARGLGSGVVAAGRPTKAQEDRLIELSVALQISKESVTEDIQGMAEVSDHFKKQLEGKQSASQYAVASFVQDVLNIRKGTYTGASGEFFEAGTQAIQTSFALWDATYEALDGHIRTRIEEKERGFYIEVALTAFCAFVFVLVGVITSRNILRTLQNALGAFTAIVNGNYQQAVEMRGNNELSQLTRGINSMRIKMGFEVEDAAARAAEASRIKQALDVAQANVMMADAGFNIIYMNDAIKDMFTNVESALKVDLPDFDAKRLMGQNVDVFHKNPDYQRKMMDSLTRPHKAQIVIGGRTFSLVATPVFGADKARLGTVVEWEDLTDALAASAEERRVANENLRIKQALDNVSANVMVADKGRNIIYMNRAVVDTLRNAQEDMRKDLPNFDVDKLQGASIDTFHKHPEHQAKLLDNLTSHYNASIVVGGRHMDLSVNPIINTEGERLGTVVEWADRTAEVAIEHEIDQLVEAASHGDLTQRIALEGKTGFFQKLSTGLNDLVASASQILGDLGETIEAMAEGDLTKQITNEYRGQFETIKQNANLTNEKLSTIISQIREAANTVNTAANEIAQGNADLSQRTEEQASSLEETASSMEQMTSTVKQSADAAHEANSLSLDARKKAQSGGEVVHQAIQAMGEILKSSNRINDIISVIDEIAFQTNLLALNAAVEAARAGEQGRGFAVVAGEVRNLSQRSAAAAKEIKDLIKDSVTKVEAGSTLVNESGDTLSALVHAVEKVAHMIAEISNAANEQTSGIEQINQAVAQMDEMTQQNAALVEEASAASEAMSEQASNMNRLVSFFRLGDVTETYTAHTAPSGREGIKTYQPASTGKAGGAPSAGSHSSFADDDDDWEEF